jgi:hypothetical protein
LSGQRPDARENRSRSLAGAGAVFKHHPRDTHTHLRSTAPSWCVSLKAKAGFSKPQKTQEGISQLATRHPPFAPSLCVFFFIMEAGFIMLLGGEIFIL